MKKTPIQALIKAFQDYLENTEAEYGKSRMFDCGSTKAREAIKLAQESLTKGTPT